MVHISCPTVIHIFTPISFPQLLIIFLVYPYILMEPLKPLSLLFHMLIFLIYQSFISLNIRSGKVLHQIGILTCDSHHNFAAIQGIGCKINCLNFCTLWKGVCTYIFSILDCISQFDNSEKHSDIAPTSSVDEIKGVSPLPSCRFYTLAHDHGVHDFFNKSFIQKQFSQLIKVNMNIC